ncbi:hypothetical protein, partial [Salmonella enterica]|uniref:hypothetical protein n=1 Tax=Salmonella enterica TaxID=28901 RepID=UPI0019D3DEAD
LIRHNVLPSGQYWHYCRRALRLFGLALNTDKKAQATAPFLWMQQDEKTANRGWDYPQPERRNFYYPTRR